MVYKRIILDVALPDDYSEDKIDKALNNTIRNKNGKVIGTYLYQDIDENGEYIILVEKELEKKRLMEEVK